MTKDLNHDIQKDAGFLSLTRLLQNRFGTGVLLIIKIRTVLPAGYCGW
jgi:hypothetical protein